MPSEDPGGTDSQTDVKASKSRETVIIELTVCQYRTFLIATVIFVAIAAVGVGLWIQNDTITHWSADPEVSTTLLSADPEVSTTRWSADPEVSTTHWSADPEVSTTHRSADPEVSTTHRSADPEVSTTHWSADPEVSATHWNADPELLREMGPEALAMFRQHDVNNDGALDAREFEPLAHILVDVNVSLLYELPIHLDDTLVTIKSYLQPLDLQSMQILSYDLPVDSPELAPLSALKQWQKPAIELQNFAVRYFAIFMPKKTEPVLGDAYNITPFGSQSSDEEFRHSSMSNNRFYPPRVTGELTILHNLLAMLHPRPFINSRISPQGAMACVRAFNDDWLDISFRVHAEFQLQEPPHQPFWFTPAQFKGRLIVSRNLSNLKYFRMYVPTNKRLNVDMEWLKDDAERSMEVDIGYMPEMGLVATSESRPAEWNGYDLRTSHKPETNPPEDQLGRLVWTKEVQVDICEKSMEVVFYPFTTVPYHNYTEAYELAAKEDKLVHSIVLWGALDDQSC